MNKIGRRTFTSPTPHDPGSWISSTRISPRPWYRTALMVRWSILYMAMYVTLLGEISVDVAICVIL